jgi:sugar phosphate isomerase/epimerase
MIVEVGIHSFSLRHHFAYKPDFGAIDFAKMARAHGFQGLCLSLNDANYRHLGGRSTDRMERLRSYLETHDLSLEVDTSNTAPAHMSQMLKVAHRMGAKSLRTYTHHEGDISGMMQATALDLARVVKEASELGITIVLENHEDFTGPELANIVEQVDHPNLKILFDYGNSQMVLEDPEAALDAVLPYVYSVHVKDHVMIQAEYVGQLTVAGVPIGEGFLPLEKLTQRLLEQGLRRICFENVWSYTAPIRTGCEPLFGVVLGQGSFKYLDPPFDPAQIILNQSEFEPEVLVKLEGDALFRGCRTFFNILKSLGAKGDWNKSL